MAMAIIALEHWYHFYKVTTISVCTQINGAVGEVFMDFATSKSKNCQCACAVL
jgi:hypothetical protein